jgi:hypothetical protein
MALTKCAECGGPVSTEAKACPKCGAAPPKRTSLLTWIIGGVMLAAILSSVVRNNSEPPPPAAPAKSPEQVRADAEREAAWQAAVLSGTQAAVVIRRGMKNPRSFELRWAIRTAAGAVCLEYAGTNSFNAVVPGFGIVSPGSTQVAQNVPAIWNKHCAEQNGTDIKRGIEMSMPPL